MNWQVKYALENINKRSRRSSATPVQNDFILITTTEKPDVLAAISAEQLISYDIAEQYVQENPNIDFLCGYRAECVWEGSAISYLEENSIGWGNFGTLMSAASDGNANTAEHKVYAFASRLIRQYGIVARVDREFDRVFSVQLKNGKSIRIGMIPDYEPTGDNVRSMWEQFGPIDIAWNINPNGFPCQTAIESGDELGCKILKTGGMKSYLQTL